MHFLVITDAYYPTRTSAAVLLQDLTKEWVDHGHLVTIIVPGAQLSPSIAIEKIDGSVCMSVTAFQTKDIGYVRRTLAEWINPYLIGRALKRDLSFCQTHFDAIIWYSPSIFWGPLIAQLKRRFQCPAYLILRDIFPDWALDLGLLKKNGIYHFFKKVAAAQYQQAEVIGVQSPNNRSYFLKRNPKLNANVEVLWNWIQPTHTQFCSIDISKTSLAGRKIAVYAGNVGVAQGRQALLALVGALRIHDNLGFVFVGRGREMQGLKEAVQEQAWKHVLFFDEIAPSEIPGLYAQCHIGLVALDPRHQTHNIPGKFVSYMQSGLPVFAVVNPGNDLVDLIETHQVGVAKTAMKDAILKDGASQLLSLLEHDPLAQKRCVQLAAELFSPAQASQQILSALKLQQ